MQRLSKAVKVCVVQGSDGWAQLNVKKHPPQVIISVLCALVLSAISACDGSTYWLNGPPTANVHAPDTNNNGGSSGQGTSNSAGTSPETAGASALGGQGGTTLARGGAAGAGHSGTTSSCELGAVTCTDWIEGDDLERWSIHIDEPSAFNQRAVPGVRGKHALEVQVTASSPLRLRYEPISPLNVPKDAELRFVVRGKPHGSGFSAAAVTLEDRVGKRQSYSVDALAASKLYTTHGQWAEVHVPLIGGATRGTVWSVSGSAVDFTNIAALELHAQAELGFELALDGAWFDENNTVCRAVCPNDCHGRGYCDPLTFACQCELGGEGQDCQNCSGDYTLVGARCLLKNDTPETQWPNSVSSANGDEWLRAHHSQIQKLRPRLLVLNFVNENAKPASKLPAIERLISDTLTAFRVASQGFDKNGNELGPMLDYELVRRIDFRDGENGRPPMPAHYPFENSSVYPRVALEDGKWVINLMDLGGREFAELFGYADPQNPGEYLPLCQLFEAGRINEVWVIASQAAPEARPVAFNEFRRAYDTARRPLSDFYSCRDSECGLTRTPADCKRGIRIAFLDYEAGPGCALQNISSTLTAVATQNVVPALSEWFKPFAGLDLNSRFDLPFVSFAALGPSLQLSYPSPSEVVVSSSGFSQHIAPYAASCGQPMLPPNASKPNDFAAKASVNSMCPSFGRACDTSVGEPLTSSVWKSYETAATAPGCGGPYLLWWYKQMPTYGSGHRFRDGREMLSFWPFLFY